MPETPPPLTADAFRGLAHPLQRRRFALALFFALILFPLIAAALAAGTIILIVPVFAFLIWLSGRVSFAYFMGNSILVSDLNYPRINRLGEELKDVIGYRKTVNIFVYEQGNFNAYLMKFFFYRRAVFLNSELLEAGVSDDELRWLIGRFIGYLRARQQAGFWGWTIRAAEFLIVFNLFLLPYERALQYTGDRIALAVIAGDITSAVSAMQKLFVGRQLGYSVNPNGLVDQHRLVKGSIFAFLARLGMAFPHLTSRYVDLIGFAKARFAAQFERFEAENPGLPVDLRPLTALPQADPSQLGTKDPVWGALAGAVAVLALITVFTVKVIVPQYRHAAGASAYDTTLTPSELTDTTTAPPPPPPPPDPNDPSTQTVKIPSDNVLGGLDASQQYVSTDGRFTAAFSGTPKRDSKRIVLSGTDSTVLHQTHVEDNNHSFTVVYNDYPAKYVQGEPQSILESVRDGSLQSSKATASSDEVIDLNGVPGRAFQFTDSDGVTYYVHEFLNGARLYQVIAIVGAGASQSDAQDFLNSFRIQ